MMDFAVKMMNFVVDFVVEWWNILHQKWWILQWVAAISTAAALPEVSMKVRFCIDFRLISECCSTDLRLFSLFFHWLSTVFHWFPPRFHGGIGRIRGRAARKSSADKIIILRAAFERAVGGIWWESAGLRVDYVLKMIIGHENWIFFTFYQVRIVWFMGRIGLSATAVEIQRKFTASSCRYCDMKAIFYWTSYVSEVISALNYGVWQVLREFFGDKGQQAVEKYFWRNALVGLSCPIFSGGFSRKCEGLGICPCFLSSIYLSLI